MGLRSNLQALMQRAGENPHSLAMKVRARYGYGPTQPTLLRILDGVSKEPRRSSLQPVADFFSVKLDDLCDGDLVTPAPARVVSPGAPGFDCVPVRSASFRLSPSAAGYALDFSGADSPPVFFRREWLEARGYVATKLVAVRVSGQSMNPTLFDGDVLVVNLADTQPADGQVFVVNYEGDAIVKRLRRDRGEWWLSADNPDKLRFGDKRCEADVPLLGRAVYRQSEYI